MRSTESIDLSLMSMTSATKVITVNVSTNALTPTATMTLSATPAQVTTINAAASAGVSQTGRAGLTAANYTGGLGADRFIMNNTGDTIDGGGGKNDTLDVNFTAVLGGLSIDLSSAAEQITTMDGGATAGTVSGFENIDLAGFAGFGAAITAIKTGSTIIGSAAVDRVTGGAAVDTITGGAGGDVLTGGGGADIFNIPMGDSLNGSIDTIQDFTNGTDVLIITGTEGTADDFKAVADLTTDGNGILDATAANKLSILLQSAPGTNLASTAIDKDSYQLGTTAAVLQMAASSEALGGNRSDFITAGATNAGITGGSGADVMTGAGGTDTVIWTGTTAALMATETGVTAGTDVDAVAGSAGDQVNTWTSGTDKLNFRATLTTNAIGTEADNLITIGAGGTVTNATRYLEITAAFDGTTGDAITDLNAANTGAVAIGDSFIAFMQDGTDGYLYLVEQVSAANTIAAQDVTLIGTVMGVTNIANADLVSY
jgi:hypothetical protein